MENASAGGSVVSLTPVRSPLHSFATDDLITTPYGANRYDYEKWFHDFHTPRSMFLTGVFNNYIRKGFGDKNIEKMKNTHRHFFNDLHRQVFTKSKRKLPRVVVIERGALKGFHSHIIIETPEHLSRAQFRKMMKDAWKKTKYGVNLHIVDGYDKNRLDEYCSKELGNENKSYSNVDEKNCCR